MPCWLTRSVTAIERLSQLAQVADQAIGLGQGRLAEVLDARTGVADHRVEVLGRLPGPRRSTCGGPALRAGPPRSSAGWCCPKARDPLRRRCLPGGPRCGRRRWRRRGRARARRAREVVLSTFSRMSEIAFWFLSLSNSVSRSVRRWIRSISSGALLSERAKPARGRREYRAALRPDLGDRRRALDRAVELDFADAGEADALDLGAGALEHRGLIVDLDPHPDELGPAGKQADLLRPRPPERPRR